MVTMRSRPFPAVMRRLAILPSARRRRLRLTWRIRSSPAKDATAYPAVDFHTKEQVAIAAEPFDTGRNARSFRSTTSSIAFFPSAFIVTNTGDHPVSLRDARIFFISAEGDKVPAAEPEDVERRVRPKDSRGHDIPVGPIKLHTKGSASDDKIEADFDRFEYAALAVEPHTTRAGFLFYRYAGSGRHSAARRETGFARACAIPTATNFSISKSLVDKYLEAKR